MKTPQSEAPFPWTVQKGMLFEAEVVSAEYSGGTRTILFQGQKVLADFIATAANRQSNETKGVKA